MSGDPLQVVNIQLMLIGPVIFAFSWYKAYQIRKVLVGEAYRRRATWNAVLSLFLIPLQSAIIVFLGHAGVAQVVSFLLVSLVIASNIVGFLFLDSAITAARQMDFFSRDTLAWGKTRYFVAALFLLGMLGTLFGPSSTFTQLTGNVLWPITWAYAAAVLGLSSARVSDRVMRNYAKWIGAFAASVAFGFLIPGFNLTIILVSIDIGTVFFYQATSALSLTGDMKTVGSPLSSQGANP